MRPTEVLKEEHQGILRVLAVVEKGSARLATGKDVPVGMFVDAVDFFRMFADKCHHGKEEAQLFPAMERAGIPRQGGPLGVMLVEHDQGRALVRQMGASAEALAKGDVTARQPLIAATRGFVELLRQHIYKEDNILYGMADAAVPEAEQKKLIAAFDEVERTVMGPGVHERYHAMIDEMEKLTAAW